MNNHQWAVLILAAWTVKLPAQTPFRLENAGAVRSVAFSPDGKRLACGCDDATVRVIDPETGAEQYRLTHRAAVEDVVFSPDGTLATAGRDRVIRLWNHEGKPKGELPGHRIGTTSLAFADGGRLLVSGGNDGIVRIWDPKSGTERRRLEGHEADVRAVAVSADGSRIASASYDGTIRLWDARAGRELRLLVTMKREATAVAITPDGRRVVGGGVQGRVRFWDSETGLEATELDRGSASFTSLASSGDGRMLTGAEGHGERVVVWDVCSGTVRRVLPVNVRVLAVTFDRSAQRLALARADGSVAVERFRPLRAIADPELAWETLRSTDGAAAFEAILTLAADPERSLALLRRHVLPARAPDEKRLRQLLTEIESDDFATREAATRTLEDSADTVADVLRKLLRDGKPSLDARTRLERILRPVEEPLLSGEQLRIFRVVECLERIGTPEPRQFLEELAKGATGALLTEQARAAVARLTR